VVSSDEVGQVRGADRLETALRGRYAAHRPGCDRFSKAFGLVSAEIAQAEQIAEQATRGSCDDNLARLRQGLKPCGKAWRIANDGVLAQGAFSAAVTDHYQSGGNANAHGKRLTRRRVQSRNGAGDLERRSHGSLGVIFVGT